MAKDHTKTDTACRGGACSASDMKEKSGEHGHNHENAGGSAFRALLPALISFVLLVAGLVMDFFIRPGFFSGYVRLVWYAVAYIPVGIPVLKEAIQAIGRRDIFNEFTLMGVATLGAFAIGEYPEGVAVMLFYSVGEYFQGSAVSRAQRNIKALLDVRPDTATVIRNNKPLTVSPEEITIGETIELRAGEKSPLDGTLLSDQSSFNTSALTGESRPKTIRKGEAVLAGMVNIDRVVRIRVDKVYADSSLARILDMVQNASSRKAKTELMVRRFARVYTPIVFALAVLITLLPMLFANDYVFSEWLYRALVFMVISCPCALVVSVPLGYFGGIGAASHKGILFKGANYLDIMASVNTVVMDKTGTLTEGVFSVQQVVSPTFSPTELVTMAAALESCSTHPIAKAITEYQSTSDEHPKATEVEEIAGHGLKGTYEGKELVAGNARLMRRLGIDYDTSVDNIPETTVIVALDGKYAGYIVIADKLKEDARQATSQLHQRGVRTVMLSGDKSSIVAKTAAALGIDSYYGDLLPEGKVEHIEELKKDPENIVAFVGDGINDAPVLALSDVGIAMGGLGSDAAIEIADVVIQTDQPSGIVTAMKVSAATRRVVKQNIVLALSIKALVLALGALGIATMWEAVFADVGVALLAILNSMRILRMKF